MLLVKKYFVSLDYSKMSNDLASTVPIQKALTSDMQLGLKTTAPKSRSYNVSISPSNKSVFIPNDQIIFDIPTGRHGTWLDQSQTYLKLSVQFASTAAVQASQTGSITLDNSAYSFIRSFYCYQGSNQLEFIDQYGSLANYLIDHQLSQADKAGLSASIGTNPYSNSVTTAATAGYTQYSTVNTTSSPGDRTGLPVTTVATASGIATAVPYIFTLPILSAVVGVNASKMINLKDLTGTINLQFFLATNDDAIFYGTTGAGATWQISNAELVCCFVEIEDDNFNHSDPNIPQYISGKTYRTASTTLATGSVGQMDLLVGLRSNSLTQLIARFRNNSTAVQGADATCAYRLSSSVSPNLASYYWKINNQLIPQKPVFLVNGTMGATGGQAFIELSKSFHAMGSVLCNGSVTHLMYNVAQANTLGSYPAGKAGFAGPWPVGPSSNGLCNSAYNAFSIATELEIFSNRTDTILCGINTQNSPLFLSINILTATTASTVCEIYGQMDVIFVIQHGQITPIF